MSNLRNFKRLPARFSLLIAITIGLLLFSAARSANSQTPIDGVSAAWQRATAVGSYRFTVNVDQTLIPLAAPGMIGQQGTVVNMRADGEVKLPDYSRLELTVASAPGQSVGMINDGNRMFVLKNNVPQPTQKDPTSEVLPATDYSLYAEAATDIHSIESQSINGQTYTRYAFTIDGPRLAQAIIKRMNQSQGAEIQSSPMLIQMTGTGELWVDQSGLPYKQILNLDLPQVNAQYASHSRMVAMFSDFGSITSIQRPVQSPDGSWKLESTIGQSGSATRFAPIVSRALPPIAAIVIVAFGSIAIVLLYISNRKRTTAFISVTVALLIAFSPIFQMVQVVDAAAQPSLQKSLSDLLQPAKPQVAVSAPESAPIFTRAINSQVQSISAPSAPIHGPQCGDGTAGVDTDQDKLTDQQELCLGTDPFNDDTDYDSLSDGLETLGAVVTDTAHITHTLTSNPLKIDSNGDGLSDSTKYPAPYGSAPDYAVNANMVWQTDTDGDGVPNDADLSPTSRTAFVPDFKMHTSSAAFSGAEYIDFQVQPQDLSHLRYSLGSLSWPLDDKAQITFINDITDNIHLRPMLDIQSNVAPDSVLASHYNVNILRNDFTAPYAYRLMVPLSPVGDQNQAYALQGRLAFDSAQLADVKLQVKVVWVVQADIEYDVNGEIVSSPQVVQTYPEPSFRVTGLQVTKSGNVQSALIGTPGTPSDDRSIFQILFGMSATYLDNLNPTLSEIATRFNQPNTPIQQRWGVTATTVAQYKTYAHIDEAIAGTAADAQELLSTQYSPTVTPTLITALQQDLGSYSQDDQGVLTATANLDVNLANVPMITTRNLGLSLYTNRGGAWTGLSEEDVLNEIYRRYADIDALVAAYQVQYPNLTTNQLRNLTAVFYDLWLDGQGGAIVVDDQPLVPTMVDDAEVMGVYNLNQPDLVTYLHAVGEFGNNIPTDPGAARQLIRSLGVKGKELGLGTATTMFGPTIFAKLCDFCPNLIDGVKGGGATTRSLIIAFRLVLYYKPELIRAVGNSIKDVLGLGKLAASATPEQAAAQAAKAAKVVRNLKFALRTFSVIVAAFTIGYAWAVFAKTNFENPVAFNNALAHAIATTVVALIILALAFAPPPIDILGAVLALLDVIIGLATDGEWDLARVVVELFYSAKTVTELGGVNFGDAESHLVHEDQGLTTGNTFATTNQFNGTMIYGDEGDAGTLQASYVQATMHASAPNGGATAADANTARSCLRNGTTLYCENTAGAEFYFNQPGINVHLRESSSVEFRWYYKECGLYGAVCGSSIAQVETLPKDGPTINDFYVDVLPNTVTGLWTWSALTNADPDADGLTNAQETARLTNPNLADTDSDGLPDGYEVSIGTDPLVADTDHDGLTDSKEIQLGTDQKHADTDGDGLNDGVEVAGWLIKLPGNRTVRVYSNPLIADADGDGLIDSTEMADAVSPNAFNNVPRLTLSAAPLSTSPDGSRTALFVAPGQPITLTTDLWSTGPLPITGTLAICLPSLLTNLAGGALTGSHTPAAQIDPCPSGGTRYRYNFSGSNTLQFLDQVSSTVTAKINPVVTTSVVAQINVALPYPTQAISNFVPIIVDVDNPNVTLDAPVNGQLLRGSSYVVGGTASDPTSWVSSVQVDLGTGSFVNATDISANHLFGQWAKTWILPTDGIYTLRSRSIDYLSHLSSIKSIAVTVDNTPPVINFPFPNRSVVRSNNPISLSIPLSGTVSDNLSGVKILQLAIDKRPFQIIAFPSGAWNYTWILPNDGSAQGDHLIRMRAFDQAGNASVVLTRTLIVDALPPTDSLVNSTYNKTPIVKTNKPITLTGFANDAGNAPLPARPVALQGTVNASTGATVRYVPRSVSEDDSGINIVWLGDVNGDNLADYAVGYPASNGGTGKVIVVYGKGGNFQVPPSAEDIWSSNTSFIGQAGAGIGAKVSAAGDVNGDGFSDILIGDPIGNHVYLIFGHPAPLGKDLVLGNLGVAGRVKFNAPISTTIGSWISSAGDANGDGFADLLIGAAAGGANPARAYLYLGHANPWLNDLNIDGAAAATLPLPIGGAPAIGVGDTNGDQLSDFALISATGVDLYRGRATFTVNAMLALTATNAVAHYNTTASPQIIGLGNVNGDSFADFAFMGNAGPQLILGAANVGSMVQKDLSGYAPVPTGLIVAPGDVNADGKSDLVLSVSGNQTAYLISNIGGGLPPIQATITGTQMIASTPYKGGADFNSDGSDDLLVVPYQSSSSPLKPVRSNLGDPLRADQLPQSFAASQLGGSCPNASIGHPFLPLANLDNQSNGFPLTTCGNDSHAPSVAPTVFYVSDDYCSACLNDGHTWNTDAFNTVQGAINAADSGDTINVLAGTYPPFTIDSKDNLNVIGVNADAVFVDGGGAAYTARLSNTIGITLSNFTFRNAARGIQLINAGVGGYITSSLKINIDHSVVYSFTSSAIEMDRSSVANLSHNTLGDQVNSTAFINVVGSPDAALVPTWTTLSNSLHAANSGGGLMIANGLIYAAAGGSASFLDQYTPGGSWSSLTASPFALDTVAGSASGNNGSLYSLMPGRWSPMTGLTQQPNDFAIDPANGNVYAVGSNNPTPAAAYWNGSSWQSIIDGVEGSGLNSIAIDGNNIYLAGSFTSITPTAGMGSATTAANLIIWNKVTHAITNMAAPGYVKSVVVNGGVPYIISGSGTNMNIVYVYSGGIWNTLLTVPTTQCTGGIEGSYLWDMVFGTAPNGGTALYVGGKFGSATPQSGTVTGVNNLVGLYTSGITATAFNVGGGVYYTSNTGCPTLGLVQAVAAQNGSIYPGGIITHAGTVAVAGAAAYNPVADTWSAMGSGLSYPYGNAVVYGAAGANSNVYYAGIIGTAGGSSVNNVARWNGSAWRSLGTAPYDDGTFLYSIAAPANAVYVGGSISTTANFGGSDNVGMYSRPLGVYNIGGNSWSTISAFPQLFYQRPIMIGDGSNHLYLLKQSDGSAEPLSAEFYQYNTTSNALIALTSMPSNAQAGAAMALVGGDIYVLAGGGTNFYKYNIAGNSWTTLANSFNIGAGAGLAYDGLDSLYATNGGNGNLLARYRISKNAWDASITIPNVFTVNDGGGLVRIGNDLYLTRGNGQSDFVRYGPIGLADPIKLTIDHTAFVAPIGSSAATWITPSLSASADFTYTSANNQWIDGGSWTPAASTITSGAANFVDETHNVYRVKQISSLTSGYYTYHADANVSPLYCSVCTNDGHTWSVTAFDTIQSAINSGAQNVFVKPGDYHEQLYLLNGVNLIGAGADLTLLNPPLGNVQAGSALIKADGIAASQIARVSLVGDGVNDVNGVNVSHGARSIKITRNILRELTDGISIDGAATQPEIFNNTIVYNINGITATNCGNVDVRNTAFAFNSGDALNYQTCAATELHTYNAYWSNGRDLVVDGTSQTPGLNGEFIADPEFVDTTSNDFSLSPSSALIAKGNPNDPVPPGAGTRIDIGYQQSGAAAFYVDDDYSDTGLNDGLIWQANAFDKIQDASNAANNVLTTILCLNKPNCNVQVTIGVGTGTYTETNISLPSHARLISTNVDQTIIDGGNTGSVISLTNKSDVTIDGFTLRNSGGSSLDAGVRVGGSSNHITITHSLIKNNQNGIVFEGSASGLARFNTLANNTSIGVLTSGSLAWLNVEDNIVANNPTGLQTQSGSHINNKFNLLFNTTNYNGAVPGPNEIIGDPLFVGGGSYRLQATSPAIDQADPTIAAPSGGGAHADMGYQEVLAWPLDMLFGTQGTSTTSGNSGMQSVQVGITRITTPSLLITQTLPAVWNNVNVKTPGQVASLWTGNVTPTLDGLYRLYSRATDQIGNQMTGSVTYRGTFFADSVLPQTTWVSPTNGLTTTQAAIQLIATASDYVTPTSSAPQFDIASTYFLVDGAAVPASWTDPNWTSGGGQPAREFRAWAALTNGAHTLRAVSIDQAGNVGTTLTRTITATTPSNVATIVLPYDTASINKSTFEVRGYARFINTTNFGHVSVAVSGGGTFEAKLANPLSLLTSWSVTVTLPSTGTHTLTPSATRNSNPPLSPSAPADTALTVLLNQTPPSISITSPTNGSFVTPTVTFIGTASASAGTLTNVDVSIDGGIAWLPATLNGNNWSLIWSAPDLQDAISYPVIARATDDALNQATTMISITIDTTPPTGIVPVIFSAPEGSYLNLNDTLVVTWTAPSDNSGPVIVKANIDQVSGTNASTIVGGTTLPQNLNAGGNWFTHLSAIDIAGNRIDRNYGPWHVNSLNAINCANRTLVTSVDGVIDLDHSEWNINTDLLDNDARPNAVQSLFTNWDADNFYIGWSGSRWAVDGALFIYLGTQPLNITTTPIPNDLNSGSLPFAANYAIEVTGTANVTLYQYDGSSWQAVNPIGFAFAHDEDSAGTEIRMPFGAMQWTSAVRMFAFAVDKTNQPFSVFPTSNAINPLWTSNYRWNNLCTDTPNANQPQGRAVDLTLASPQSILAPLGPNSVVTYTLQVKNNEAITLTNAQLLVEATANLDYLTIDGVTCGACPIGNGYWQINLPPLLPKSTLPISITGELASALGGINAITTTATLNVPTRSAPTIKQAALTHPVDSQPPSVTLFQPPAQLQPGQRSVFGSSDDGAGIGVAQVEIRAAGSGTWNIVSGTLAWTAAVTVPQTQVITYEVRAIDLYGQTSPIGSYVFAVDTISPTVDFQLPYRVIGQYVEIPGEAQDFSPVNGLVSQVQVQLDSDSNAWQPAIGPFDPDNTGAQAWHFTWSLPEEWGVTHMMRARSIDAAGNVSDPSAWQTTQVYTSTPIWRTYVPIVQRDYVSAPDLIVKSIVATTNTVQVVIANVGTSAVDTSFWVDAYINPSSAPTHVNQTWQQLGAQGLVWAVTTSPTNTLNVGAVITLTIGGQYYSPINSHLNGPLPIGTKIYAQVDSANANVNYGAVLEIDEIKGLPYNNIFGPVLSTLSVTEMADPTVTLANWLNDLIDSVRNDLPVR
jgi:hypothetical protein